MNFNKISQSIDVDRMQNSKVVMVGGANGLVSDLVRCGLGKVVLIDFDHVESSNIPRQDFFTPELGRKKIEALANRLLQVNPDLNVETYVTDYCTFTHSKHDEVFEGANLAIYSTDFFPAQARGNVEALRSKTPAIWIGLYKEGRAGEVIHYVPGVTPACFQCIAIDRYKAFRSGGARIPSDGGTIFDLRQVDAVAGQIALGILNRGSEGRYGKLIDQLGDRNLLQIKMDPEYKLGSKDIFAKYLGDNPANFSFSTIALSMDPDDRCEDCPHFANAAASDR
jgi:ThiF family